MPQYSYRCSSCDYTTELTYSVSDAKTVQPPCTECDGSMSKTFIAANWRGQVQMKGEWPGKTLKEKRYRANRTAVMDRRQRERYAHTLPTLAPNVGGEQVETWGDAKKIVKERGGDVTDFDRKVNNLSGKKNL